VVSNNGTRNSSVIGSLAIYLLDTFRFSDNLLDIP
jgi:hypothetical protein